jgi:DNA-binding transcriptional LysR family regulator
VRTRLRTASCEAIREAVISGAGIGLRPAWHIDRELAEGRLQVLLPDYRRVGCSGIFAVYPSRELMPRKARSFLEFLAGTYGPRPYWERYLPPGRTPDRTTVDETAAMRCVDGSRS